MYYLFLVLVMALIHTIFSYRYCYDVIFGQFDVVVQKHPKIKLLLWNWNEVRRNEEGSLTWGIRAIYSIFLDFFYRVSCRRALLLDLMVERMMDDGICNSGSEKDPGSKNNQHEPVISYE